MPGPTPRHMGQSGMEHLSRGPIRHLGRPEHGKPPFPFPSSRLLPSSHRCRLLDRLLPFPHSGRRHPLLPCPRRGRRHPRCAGSRQRLLLHPRAAAEAGLPSCTGGRRSPLLPSCAAAGAGPPSPPAPRPVLHPPPLGAEPAADSASSSLPAPWLTPASSLRRRPAMPPPPFTCRNRRRPLLSS
jgi:hypothetical protein